TRRFTGGSDSFESSPHVIDARSQAGRDACMWTCATEVAPRCGNRVLELSGRQSGRSPMRCRNCHTVMMDTDTHCPTCHSSVARAPAAAPGPIAAPSPMLIMLPVFGGAIGGAIAGAIAASSTATAPSRHVGSLSYGAPARRGPGPLRWTFGILFMLGGGL